MHVGDKGLKDKSKRERQKKAKLTPKEQRRLRNEKKAQIQKIPTETQRPPQSLELYGSLREDHDAVSAV